MVGLRLSGKAPDREHPYGHERMECVAAIVLAGVLLVTGLLIGYAGAREVLGGQVGDKPVPGVLALVASIVSIAVKEGMFWYTRAHARRLASPALMADAWHHRSDALSSVGALIGIAGARLGVPMMDPLASVVICAFIVKAAFDIFRDAVDRMVDHSGDAKTEGQIRERVLAHEGVRRIDVLRTREFGSRLYVELEIALDDALTLSAAHAIAEEVHDDVEKAFPRIKHIMIHVNPAGEKA
jgi:cation diffusion facilitator family transporter